MDPKLTVLTLVPYNFCVSLVEYNFLVSFDSVSDTHDHLSFHNYYYYCRTITHSSQEVNTYFKRRMRISFIHFFYPFEVHFNTHKMQSTKFAQTTLRYLFGSKAFQLWSFSHFTPTHNKSRTSPQYILHLMSTCISILLVQDEEAVRPHLYSPNTHQSTSLLVLVISSIDRSYCKSTRLRMSDCVQKIGH